MIEHIELLNTVSNSTLVLDMVSTDDYILESFTIDPLNASYTFQELPSLYGETLSNSRFITRKLKIVGWIIPPQNFVTVPDAEALRTRKAFISAFFVPTQEIVLSVKSKDRASDSLIDLTMNFLCDSTVKFGETVENNNEYMCRFEISGTCLSPFFKYVRLHRNDFSYGGIYDPNIYINNYGDMPCGFELTSTLITSDSGGTNVEYELYEGSGTSGKKIGYVQINPRAISGINMNTNDSMYFCAEHGAEELSVIRATTREVINFSGCLVWRTLSFPIIPIGLSTMRFRSSARFNADFKVTELYMGVI